MLKLTLVASTSPLCVCDLATSPYSGRDLLKFIF